MGKIWETFGLVAITALVLMVAVDLIRPYVPWLLLAGGLVLAGKFAYRQYEKRRYW